MGLGLNPNGEFPTVSGHLSDTIRLCPILRKPWSHTGETKKKRKLTGALGSVQIGLKIRCPQGRVGSSPSSGTLKIRGLQSCGPSVRRRKEPTVRRGPHDLPP